MKQLCKMHNFTLIKNKANVISCMVFCFIVPILIKLCLFLVAYEGNEVSFKLSEMQIIVILWVQLFSTFFYYRQQKSKVFLQEKINGFSMKTMFLSRMLVLELWMLAAIIVFYGILCLVCEQIRVMQPYYFPAILLVYFKSVFLISCVFIIIRDALAALLINWMAFSSLHVLLMTMNKALDKDIASIFSYSILSKLSDGSITVLDIGVWGVTSIVQIMFLVCLINYIYKKMEWK